MKVTFARVAAEGNVYASHMPSRTHIVVDLALNFANSSTDCICQETLMGVKTR